MVKKTKFSLFHPNFLQLIHNEIQINPDIVNTIEEDLNSSPYIKTASAEGLVNQVAYLIDNKADVYLLDVNKNSALNAVIGAARIAKKENDQKKVENCYKIFRILLNFESEQRSDFPEKYKKQILLKDCKNKLGITPQEASSIDKEVEKELQKAIDEAAKHYQNCLKAKALEISLKPYHKQFLPIIGEQYPIEAIEATPNWTKKTNETHHEISNAQSPSIISSRVLFKELVYSPNQIDKATSFFNSEIDIYSYDDNKDSFLNIAVGEARMAKRDKETNKFNYWCKIFKILLHYEAEQRAYFPQKYENQIWLKDHINDLDLTTQEIASIEPNVEKELQEAVDEAKKYYQNCLKAKALEIPLKPYHKQFLPMIEGQYSVEAIEATAHWTKKIGKDENIYRPINKDGDKETQPLLNDYKNKSLSLKSRLKSFLKQESSQEKLIVEKIESMEEASKIYETLGAKFLESKNFLEEALKKTR